MVTELQYFAIVGYLLWCLLSSLSSMLRPNEDDAPLVQHRNVAR
jgi:hypothetical protein